MVMFHGRIVGTFTRDALDVDEVGLLMIGSDGTALANAAVVPGTS
jgi:hypothetical protein